MRRAFFALPGPVVVKIVIATLIVVVTLIALHFIYSWMGDRLIDTGGSIG